MTKLLVNKIATLSGHKDSLYSLEGSGTPSKFYSAGSDGMVVEWDLTNPKDGKLVVKLSNSVYSMRYIEAENHLLIGQNFTGIHKVDLSTNEEIMSAAITKAAIFDIQVEGSVVYLGTGDGELIVLSLEDLSVIKKIKLSHERIRSIAVLIDELVIGFSDNIIRIVDRKTFQVKNELDSHTNSVFKVFYNKHTKTLLSSGRDAKIIVWDTETWQRKESIAAHMYAVNDLVSSPSGEYFASCSMDKSIKVWDTKSNKLLKVIDKARHAGHGTSVNKLLWSVYNNYIVSCSDDRTISIWELKSND